MKKTLIVSMFCISALGSYAQSADDHAAERQRIHERAVAIYNRTHGNMGPATVMHYNTDYSNVHAAYPDAPVNATPATPGGDYVALQDPPCYKFKNKNGKNVMACPGAKFANGEPQGVVTTNGNEFRAEGTYTGYYNNLSSIYPNAPANAQAAWPSTEYQELQNPPCYKYINPRGLEVMECPGAFFEPEHRHR